jgi:hypothetical protein
MSTTAWMNEGLKMDSFADTALKASDRFWFVVNIIGQLLFAFAVASFYGMAAVRENWAKAWSKHFTHGYVHGEPGRRVRLIVAERAGNLARSNSITAAL